MCEERRNEVHHKRPFLLQLGADNKCRRCRGYPCSVHKGLKNRVASYVKELGPKLAEQFLPRWPKPLFPSYGQRWKNRHQLQRRALRLAIRTNLRRRSVLGKPMQLFVRRSVLYRYIDKEI